MLGIRLEGQSTLVSFDGLRVALAQAQALGQRRPALVHLRPLLHHPPQGIGRSGILLFLHQADGVVVEHFRWCVGIVNALRHVLARRFHITHLQVQIADGQIQLGALGPDLHRLLIGLDGLLVTPLMFVDLGRGQPGANLVRIVVARSPRHHARLQVLARRLIARDDVRYQGVLLRIQGVGLGIGLRSLEGQARRRHQFGIRHVFGDQPIQDRRGQRHPFLTLGGGRLANEFLRRRSIALQQL